jgi:hypothetical protein
VKKILERIYGVDGVAQARVWCWTNQVAIGVLGSGAESTLVGRVTDACRGLEEEGETWTIGLLGD